MWHIINGRPKKEPQYANILAKIAQSVFILTWSGYELLTVGT